MIAGFDNLTGEALLDGTLEFALERELGSSKLIQPVSRVRLEDALRLMRKPPDSRIDLVLGKEICVRDGQIRALVSGKIDKSATGYSATMVV